MYVWDPELGQQQLTSTPNSENNGTIDGDVACFTRAVDTSDDIIYMSISTGVEIPLTTDAFTMETNPAVSQLSVMFQAVGGGNQGLRGSLAPPGTKYDLFLVNGLHPVPAVSEWGLIVMVLLTLTAGTIMCIRRRPAPAPSR